jgi:hypothetical protein
MIIRVQEITCALQRRHLPVGVLCGSEANSGVPAADLCPVVEDQVEDDEAVAAERVAALGSSSTLFSSAEVEPGTSPSVLSEGGETNGIGGRRARGKQGNGREGEMTEYKQENPTDVHSVRREERKVLERKDPTNSPHSRGSYKVDHTCNMEKEHLPEGVSREPRAEEFELGDAAQPRG